MADLPMLPPDLKPVPAEHEDAWTKIQEREPERMRAALYLVATHGMSPRRACTVAGYASGNNPAVYEAAHRYGLYKPQTDQVLEQSRALAHSYGDMLMERIMQQGDELSLKELAIGRGIEMDKIMKAEQGQRSNDATHLAMSQLLDQLTDRGFSLDLHLRPPDPAQQAVELNPLEPGDEPS